MNRFDFLKQNAGIFKGFPDACPRQLVRGSRVASFEPNEAVAHHGAEDHPFVVGWRWGEKGPITVKGSSTEAVNV